MWYRSSYYGGDQKMALAPCTKDLVEKAAQRKELDGLLSSHLVQVRQLLDRSGKKLVFQSQNPHSRKPDLKNNTIPLIPVEHFTKLGFTMTASEAESLSTDIKNLTQKLYDDLSKPLQSAKKSITRAKDDKVKSESKLIKEMEKNTNNSREKELIMRTELKKIAQDCRHLERLLKEQEDKNFLSEQDKLLLNDEIRQLTRQLKEETAIPVMPFGLTVGPESYGFQPSKKTKQAIRQQAKAFRGIYDKYVFECEEEKEKLREEMENTQMEIQDYWSRPPRIEIKEVIVEIPVEIEIIKEVPWPQLRKSSKSSASNSKRSHKSSRQPSKTRSELEESQEQENEDEDIKEMKESLMDEESSLDIDAELNSESYEEFLLHNKPSRRSSKISALDKEAAMVGVKERRKSTARRKSEAYVPNKSSSSGSTRKSKQSNFLMNLSADENNFTCLHTMSASVDETIEEEQISSEVPPTELSPTEMSTYRSKRENQMIEELSIKVEEKKTEIDHLKKQITRLDSNIDHLSKQVDAVGLKLIQAAQEHELIQADLNTENESLRQDLDQATLLLGKCKNIEEAFAIAHAELEEARTELTDNKQLTEDAARLKKEALRAIEEAKAKTATVNALIAQKDGEMNDLSKKLKKLHEHMQKSLTNLEKRAERSGMEREDFRSRLSWANEDRLMYKEKSEKLEQELEKANWNMERMEKELKRQTENLPDSVSFGLAMMKCSDHINNLASMTLQRTCDKEMEAIHKEMAPIRVNNPRKGSVSPRKVQRSPSPRKVMGATR